VGTTIGSERGPRRGARTLAGDSSAGGFALLELTIALVVLTIGLVSMLQAGSRTQALSRENRERATAHNALRAAADRVLARSDALVRDGVESWSAALLDAYGADGIVGDTFEVRGLTPLDPDVSPGRLLVVTDETVPDEELGVEAGMPRDLNGDGLIGSSDVSGDARKLPVVLEVSWRGFRGERTLRHVVWVTGV